MLLPITVALFVIDALALSLLLAGFPAALRIVARFEPDSAARSQLALERAAEAASSRCRVALRFVLVGGGAYLVAVALVLPGFVPGAMCGTGVIQSGGGAFLAPLALRGVTAVLLAVWLELDAVDRKEPRGVFTAQLARVQLAVTGFFAMTVLFAASAFGASRSADPVDCCAAYYDPAVVDARGDLLPPPDAAGWVWVSVVLTFLLLTLLARYYTGRRTTPGLAPVLAGAWAAFSLRALAGTFAAYYFGVLHHHCIWCLLLLEHDGVGFALLAAVGVVIWAAVAISVDLFAVERHAPLRRTIDRRLRGWSLKAIIGVAVFWALSAGPALLWRLVHGVWIDGEPR